MVRFSFSLTLFSLAIGVVSSSFVPVDHNRHIKHLPHLIRLSAYVHRQQMVKAIGNPVDSDTVDVCYTDDNGLPCDCTINDEVVTIDCRNETLKSANIRPVLFLSRTFKMQLNMNGNAIHELLKGKILPGNESNLEILILRDNRLQFIEDGAFSSMTNLKTLDLGRNRLTSLTRKVFAGGDGLEWELHNLYLDANQLRTLDDGVFHVLTSLKKLVLDNNHHLPLTKNTFGRMNQLTELSLDNCGLKELPFELFAGLTRLETLSLLGNQLTVIPPAVKVIRSLTSLDISENYITEFNPNALNGDYKLEQLVVRDMPYLWAVEDCAFCGLPHLKEVIFYNSTQLYYLHENAFGGRFRQRPLKIELFDVEKCNLTTLSKDLLEWEKVETVKIGNNPYACDCSLKWMTNTDMDMSSDKAPACASPRHLLGRPLSLLDESEIVCANDKRKPFLAGGRLCISLAALLMLTTVFLLFAYLCCSKRRHSATSYDQLMPYKENGRQLVEGEIFDDRSPVTVHKTKKTKTAPVFV